MCRRAERFLLLLRPIKILPVPCSLQLLIPSVKQEQRAVHMTHQRGTSGVPVISDCCSLCTEQGCVGTWVRAFISMTPMSKAAPAPQFVEAGALFCLSSEDNKLGL